MKKTKTLAPRGNPQRAPRERRMDHNSVSRPERSKCRVVAHGPAETVAQFQARGGRVEVLPSIWNRLTARVGDYYSPTRSSAKVFSASAASSALAIPCSNLGVNI